MFFIYYYTNIYIFNCNLVTLKENQSYKGFLGYKSKIKKFNFTCNLSITVTLTQKTAHLKNETVLIWV